MGKRGSAHFLLAGGLARLALLTGCLLAPGCQPFEKREDAVDAVAASSSSRRLAGAIKEGSYLVRSSAEVLAFRLHAIFPALNKERITRAEDLGRFLGQVDYLTRYRSTRQTSPLAQGAIRQLVATHCKGIDVGSPLFQTTAILMGRAGESLPTDAVTRLAFAAARNGWLFPYASGSPEVAALAEVYRGVVKQGGNEEAGRQALCMATVLAPQFWLGNPGNAEALRRMTMELGRRAPTFDEFDRLQAGSLTLADHLRLLQGTRGYLDSVREWHRDWLGLKKLTQVFGSADPRGDKYHFAWEGASALSGQVIEAFKIPGNGAEAVRLYNQASANGIAGAEQCDPTKPNQTFNPATTEIKWQQKNPVTAQFETIAGWRKTNGTWARYDGLITLADGSSTRVVGLEDIQLATRNPVSGRWVYHAGKLKETPLDSFLPADFRVLRISPSGLQDGYSQVRLWWSDRTVRVCNAYTRLAIACAFRPIPESAGGPPARGGTHPYTDGPSAAMNAARPGISLQGTAGDGATTSLNSYAHPTILDNMACGVPNPEGTTELDKFPRPQTTAGPFNDLIINAKLNSSGWFDQNGTSQGPQAIGTPEGFAAEIAQHAAIANDISEEPLRLVEHLVGENLDFRLLLTAPYTIGGGALELFYRAKGYWTPARPNYGPDSENYSSMHLIQSSTFPALGLGWLTNSLGLRLTGPGGEPADLRTPRPMAGVLTQAAFLSPAGMKVRSVAAKILRTFTCGEVNGWVPSANEARIMLPFIPTRETSSALHVDVKQNCYGCHINMDPLGAALSESFTTSVTRGGELDYFALGDVDIGATYGVRGNARASQGAIFGREVNGVQEMAQVLADSPEFARCAARRAFEGIYGRQPAYPELALIKRAAENFARKHNYKYNLLIEELVLSAAYEKGN